jgi:Xaa-Pro dipeptidase
MESDLWTVLASRPWSSQGVDVGVDVGRMRRDRHARLQASMAEQGVDVAVLLHGANVTYATGRTVRGVDAAHAAYDRPVAVVVAGEEQPHLLGGELDDDAGDVEHHPAVWPELDEGAEALARVLAEVVGPMAGKRVGVDVQTGAMLRSGLLAGATLVDAGAVVGPAKVTKSADELGCIAEAQRRNEQAMVATQRACRPGATRAEVAGVFVSELVRMGAGANLIDPIFQPMPRSRAAGPRTTTGDVAFPTGVGNPTFAEGDLVWVDTGIDHLGYASDFGRTWVVGRDPSPAEQGLFARWCDVMVAVLDVLRPGATGGDLCRAAEEAAGGWVPLGEPAPEAGVRTPTSGARTGWGRPWLPHFYLAHGVGVESAEMPLIGTDLGPAFDDSLVLAPGMVLVLEPVAWEDGVGGYRSEEIVAVTDDGWAHLGAGHPYEPFA